MTEQELKGTRSIIEYLGWEKANEGVYHFPNLFPLYHLEDNANTGTITCHETEAEFHTSELWLMKVLSKITLETFDDGENIYIRTFGMFNKETGEYMFRFNRHQLFSGKTLTECMFNAIADCTQYLNERKNGIRE